MPLQTVAVQDDEARIEIDPSLQAGLRDLDGFSHIIVLSHLHQSTAGGLEVVPFLDDTQRGVFATRSPRRPNPIGLSIVRLLRIEETTLHVSGLDLLDRTPILDIKPYVPAIDHAEADRIGWLQGRDAAFHTARADDRFDDR